MKCSQPNRSCRLNELVPAVNSHPRDRYEEYLHCWQKSHIGHRRLKVRFRKRGRTISS